MVVSASNMPTTSKVFKKLGWDFKLLDELEITDDETFLFMLTLESDKLMETLEKYAPSVGPIRRLQMGQLATWYQKHSWRRGDSWVNDLSAEALRKMIVSKPNRKPAPKPPSGPNDDLMKTLIIGGVAVAAGVVWLCAPPRVKRTIEKVAVEGLAGATVVSLGNHLVTQRAHAYEEAG